MQERSPRRPRRGASSAAQPAAAPAATPAGEPATAPAATAPAATPAAAPAVQNAASPKPAAAPAPAPKPLVAPTGAHVSVSITEQLSASKNNVGDRFTGVLAEPVTTTDGATVFPRGARVSGTVVAAKGRGRFKGAGDLGIAVTSIAGKEVSTSTYEKAAKGKGKRSAAMIGGGGGAGALIGGLAGGGKGALIGGLIGAGAGTAGAAYTGNNDVVIPSESVVTFRLRPLQQSSLARKALSVSPSPRTGQALFLFEELRWRAVDWLYAAESCVLIIGDRCRSLPFRYKNLRRAGGGVSRPVECGQVFAHQLPPGIARSKGIFHARPNAGNQLLRPARGGGRKDEGEAHPHLRRPAGLWVRENIKVDLGRVAVVYRAVSGGAGDAGALHLPGGYEYSPAGQRHAVDYLLQADAAAVSGRGDEGGQAIE